VQHGNVRYDLSKIRERGDMRASPTVDRKSRIKQGTLLVGYGTVREARGGGKGDILGTA